MINDDKYNQQEQETSSWNSGMQTFKVKKQKYRAIP